MHACSKMLVKSGDEGLLRLGGQVLTELVDAQQALAQQDSGIGRFFKAARPAAATALAVSS